MRVFAVSLFGALALAPAAAAQPNVLLIVTDDQRWDTLAYMPTVQAELVGKGVTFSNAFVVNPVCCPSRSSILTSQWSHSTGVWGNSGPYGGFHVFADHWTLPVWLDTVGYETAHIGKYLNGYHDAAYVPPGWDQWFANTTHQNNYFDWGASENGIEVAFGVEPGDYSTDVLGHRAVKFIRTSGSKPFFLYFTPKAPHLGPSDTYTTPAPRHSGAFADVAAWRPPSWNEPSVADKPRYVSRAAPLSAELTDGMRQSQLESLLAVDEAVAGILAALEETGKLADTLIIFTSDNGFMWGEHRKADKLAPYEESIRVPLVVRWDALGAQARAVTRTALNVDLAPTITAAAAIEVPGMAGRSLLPIVTGEPTAWRTSFLFEHYAHPRRVPAYCGFRGQRRKYVQYATGEEELYDLAADPYERGNQAGQARRSTLIADYRARVRRSPCRPPGFAPLGPWLRHGTDGPDRLRGTRYRDWIHAHAGRDFVDVRGGGRDVVHCGAGLDYALASRNDRDRLYGCEKIRRR